MTPSSTRDEPNPRDEGGEVADEETDYDNMDEAELEKLADELEVSLEAQQVAANKTLDEFRETHTTEQQQFIADAFIESGTVPTGEEFGISDEQAETVVAAFQSHIEQTVLSHYQGLTLDQMLEHVDPSDEPAFRRAAVKGDWNVYHDYARKVVAMRTKHGLPIGR